MLPFLQRYRELLLVAALLLLPAGTYIANAKQGRELSAVDKFFLTLSAPVTRTVDSIVGGALGLWSDYVDLRGVKEENAQLRAELAHARAKLVEARETGAQNERLHALLSFSQARKGRLVAAPVVGVSPTHRRTITIATGEGSGITEGMAVVNADGVVGRVVATYGELAEVQLVVDPGSAVAARVQRSRARVTVRGTGAEERLALANALRTDDIEEGDLLVTSGTDRIFPKGLLIGRIGSIERKPYGMYQIGEVLPAVDVAGLEEVLVMLDAADESPSTLPTVLAGDGEPELVLPGMP